VALSKSDFKASSIPETSGPVNCLVTGTLSTPPSGNLITFLPVILSVIILPSADSAGITRVGTCLSCCSSKARNCLS